MKSSHGFSLASEPSADCLKRQISVQVFPDKGVHFEFITQWADDPEEVLTRLSLSWDGLALFNEVLKILYEGVEPYKHPVHEPQGEAA